MSLYSKEISKLQKLDRKVLVLPGKALFKIEIRKIVHSHKETPRCSCFSGVMTIEAAMILPMLTFFFVTLLFFFRMMQVQMVVQDALNATGRQLALTQEIDEPMELAVAQALFLRELKDNTLIDNYVEGGRWGIFLVASEFDEREIHLRADYCVCLPMQLFWRAEFAMQQRADCRRWSGWYCDSMENSADTWVYVTENGSVYHVSENCTHLSLSIRSVDAGQLTYLRNENGGRYQECNLCGQAQGNGERIYITNQGNCYHSDLACSGIRRTIYMVRITEVGARNCCSRCTAARY